MVLLGAAVSSAGDRSSEPRDVSPTVVVTKAARHGTCDASSVRHPESSGANPIAEIGAAQTAITSSIGTSFRVKSPCSAGGHGCVANSVPAGKLLFACLWTFNRGYKINPDRCPPGAEMDSPSTITAPSGWHPIDHFEQVDPYGSHDNKSSGGFDEFYALYRITDGTELSSYDFKLSQCAEDQAAAIVAYDGVDSVVPLDPGDGQGGHRFVYRNNGNPVAIDELINQSAGDLLVACLIDGYDQGRFTRPFAYTPRWRASSPRCCQMQGFDQLRANSGGTGNLFSSLLPPADDNDDPPIDNWFGELIALQPKGGQEPCDAHLPRELPSGRAGGGDGID
jgi:hypothetical protein